MSYAFPVGFGLNIEIHVYSDKQYAHLNKLSISEHHQICTSHELIHVCWKKSTVCLQSSVISCVFIHMYVNVRFYSLELWPQCMLGMIHWTSQIQARQTIQIYFDNTHTHTVFYFVNTA